MSTDLPPALLLNADFNPLSLLPLSTLPWKETVHNVLQDQLIVVEEYDIPVRSQRFEMKLPSVVAMRAWASKQDHMPMTDHNLFFLRDKCSCAYCGGKFPVSDLTRDHVIPASRGGRTSWENIVTSCASCNHLKRDRTPEEAGMPLLWRPFRPSIDWMAKQDFFYNKRRIHETWKAYLKYAAA